MPPPGSNEAPAAGLRQTGAAPRQEPFDRAGCALRFGWLFAGFAVAASAIWSLLCSICARLNNAGADTLDTLITLQERGLLIYAIGPLVGSLLFTCAMGIATWVYRARRRAGGPAPRSSDGRS